MANLANLVVSQSYPWVQNSDTDTQAVVLAANVPENITIPTDSATGLKAGYVIFGKPSASDFYARVFNTAQGYDRVTNGTFATDSGWTKGTGWTIGAGVATATGAISTALSQTANGAYPLVAGQAYLATFTATRSAGSITLSVGGTDGTARSSSATFAEVIIAGATQEISFGTSGFTGTVDNVTIVAVASTPTDSTTGLLGAQNPQGFSIPSDGSYVSLVSAGTPTITTAFYKRGG